MMSDEENKVFWGFVRLLISCHVQENESLKVAEKKFKAGEMPTNLRNNTSTRLSSKNGSEVSVKKATGVTEVQNHTEL